MCTTQVYRWNVTGSDTKTGLAAHKAQKFISCILETKVQIHKVIYLMSTVAFWFPNGTFSLCPHVAGKSQESSPEPP